MKHGKGNNVSTVRDAQCECVQRMQGGRRGSGKFKFAKFPTLCLWNRADRAPKARGYSIKVCPDKNRTKKIKYNNAVAECTTEYNTPPLPHPHLLTPEQSHLITVRRTPNQPLSPVSCCREWESEHKVSKLPTRQDDAAAQNPSFGEQKNAIRG